MFETGNKSGPSAPLGSGGRFKVKAMTTPKPSPPERGEVGELATKLRKVTGAELADWARVVVNEAADTIIRLQAEVARLTDERKDIVVAAYSAGALAVHEEWAKADEDERVYLSRDELPEFTEAAYDYAADALAPKEGL